MTSALLATVADSRSSLGRYDMKTRYAVEEIEKKQKQEFFCSILWSAFSILLLASSIISIFAKGTDFIWFIISAICAVTSLVILYGEKKRAKFGKLKTVRGTVKKVHLKVGASTGILTASYSGFQRARYSNYGRDIHIFTVFLDDGHRVRSYTIKDTAKAFDKYYEIGDELLHIGGTRFPVKPDFHDRWLCPICGEWGKSGEKVCTGCGERIMK